MEKFIALTFILFLVIIPLIYAIRFEDNLYFTITENAIECVDLTLPDDIGVIVAGSHEYQILMTPEPDKTWSDISEQIVSTDENNTVIIPICFFPTNGKQEGDCGESFTITLASESLPSRVSNGQACISRFPDIDTESGGINDNADIFDMAFLTPLIYANQDEEAYFQIRLQSYADVAIDLEVQSDLQTQLSKSRVTLSQQNPTDTLTLTASSSEIGEHDISVRGIIRGCSDTFCEKSINAKLIVTDSPPEEAGFIVSIFPTNLNIKTLAPVLYEFTVVNNGEEAEFDISLQIPEGFTTDFQPTTVTIPRNDYETIRFTVTPANVSGVYEIVASATYKGLPRQLTKSDTGYLSINELLTDAMRQAGNNQNALDEFYNNYRNSDYGEDLESYSAFRNSLNTEEIPDQNQTVDGEEQTEKPINIWIFVISVIIAVGVLIFIIFIKRKGPTTIETKELT